MLQHLSHDARRQALTATGAGKKALFAGGLLFNNGYQGIDIYDTETQQWDPSEELSQARWGLVSASVHNIAVFAGMKKTPDLFNFFQEESITSMDTWKLQITWKFTMPPLELGVTTSFLNLVLTLSLPPRV